MIGAAAALVAGGCTGSLNQQNGLIGVSGGGLPDLAGARAAVASGAAAGDGAGAGASAAAGDAAGSPLTGLDRRAWPVVVVEVPAGQVEHQPVYFEPIVLANGTARTKDDAPTAATVLQGPSDGGSLLAEAAAAPFIFAGELVISPVRMILQPPWTTIRAPASHPAQAMPASSTMWRWVEPAP